MKKIISFMVLVLITTSLHAEFNPTRRRTNMENKITSIEKNLVSCFDCKELFAVEEVEMLKYGEETLYCFRCKNCKQKFQKSKMIAFYKYYRGWTYTPIETAANLGIKIDHPECEFCLKEREQILDNYDFENNKLKYCPHYK